MQEVIDTHSNNNRKLLVIIITIIIIIIIVIINIIIIIWYPILVNGEAINVAHTVKLLGLNISSDLRWNCHVSKISQKFASQTLLPQAVKES